MATINFNANNYDFSQEDRPAYEPLPEGYYNVIAIESEIRETKAGTGNYLQFKFEVIDGQYKGRYIWDRFNLRNPNPKAVEIAQENLARFCQSAGLKSISDSFELHHRPVKVKVSHREWNGQTQTEIKGYRKADLGNGFQAPPSNDAPF